jgi:peptidoglycan/LPS O-acetylase OafA/YrhL
VAAVRHDIWDPPEKNLAPLDGLRGFASCIVVFYHCAIFMAFYTPEAVASGRAIRLGCEWPPA